MAKNLTESPILKEKESKLMAFTRILDTRLGPDGFDGWLRKLGAENASREEKIAVLNKALRHISDEVGTSAPGLGVGYYSRELDAILTYGPSEIFNQAVGLSVPPEHPGRTVMRDNVSLVQSGTMVRGNIMNAMLPIERHGEVIGYIWANELATAIQEQISGISRTIFSAMFLCGALSVGILLLFSRRTIRDIDRIISGLRAMRSDLSQRIPSSSGEMGEVVEAINTMAEDISKANEESRRAITVLQIVLGNVDSVVYVCDPETKRLVFTNEYMNNLLQRKDLRGQLCYEVLMHRTSPCPDCPQNELYDEAGNPIMTPRYGESYNPVVGREFLVTDRLIPWHDGRLLHMEVGTDVTERKALAHAQAANQAQREFLAHMSHEIRTPMNGVLGMTRLAIRDNPPPHQLKYLKKIQSSASLLLGIINDILDFSRIESGKLAIEQHAFNLYEAVENIRELIRPGAQEKGLTFTITLEDAVPEYVVGDGLRLSQVLLNLLGNASKFTLSGFISLTISAEPLPSGEVRLTCSVKDSGIGISVEQQRALFSPFSQADISTSRKFGGTGLGLAISKALVELMGGQIQVRSDIGTGSEFYFSIDLKAAAAKPVSTKCEDGQWENCSYVGCKFLLVEDNAINQEIALAILAEMGADVDTAENGEEGVAAYLQTNYDLILMDVRMPIVDGLEATRRIRTSGKHDAFSVPIIAMTANAMQEDRDASHEAGMNDHVAKPIDTKVFKNTIRKWVKPREEQTDHAGEC